MSITYFFLWYIIEDFFYMEPLNVILTSYLTYFKQASQLYLFVVIAPNNTYDDRSPL